jgi:hypothetical protein
MEDLKRERRVKRTDSPMNGIGVSSSVNDKASLGWCTVGGLRFFKTRTHRLVNLLVANGQRFAAAPTNGVALCQNESYRYMEWSSSLL